MYLFSGRRHSACSVEGQTARPPSCLGLQRLDRGGGSDSVVGKGCGWVSLQAPCSVVQVISFLAQWRICGGGDASMSAL